MRSRTYYIYIYVRDLINIFNRDRSLRNSYEISDLITNKRDITGQLYILKKYVLNRLKHKDLSGSHWVRTLSKIFILYKNRKLIVNKLRSKTFYDILLLKTNTKAKRKSVWRNMFALNALYWPTLINRKIYHGV